MFFRRGNVKKSAWYHASRRAVGADNYLAFLRDKREGTLLYSSINSTGGGNG